jgi:opacity protein-like surface antigen
MKLVLTAAASVAVLAAPAFAQESNFYGNVGYSHISTDDADLGAIALRGGVDFNQNFGAEIEGAFGINDEEFDIGGTTANLELKHSIGAFAVGKMPVSPMVDLFGRVGYVNVELEASGAGTTVSDDDSALAFGVGGQFALDDKNGIRVGYTNYDFDESADVFDVAYVRQF